MPKATYFRVNKVKDPFSRIDNNIFRNKNLSLKARGLLCTMLSLNEEWNYSIHGLVAILKESETAVKSTLKELKECGYLEIEKTHNEKGHFNYIYVIHEKPMFLPEGENPPMDNPSVENPTQLTNKIINKQIYNTDEIKNLTTSSEPLEDKFEEFWELYPRKVSKAKAKVSYTNSLKKTTSDVILNGLKNYINEIKEKKTEEKYIAHPTTWLNQERWNDEYSQKNFSSSPISSAKQQDSEEEYKPWFTPEQIKKIEAYIEREQERTGERIWEIPPEALL